LNELADSPCGLEHNPAVPLGFEERIVRGAVGEGEDESPIVPAVFQEHAQRAAEQRECLAGRGDDGGHPELRGRRRANHDTLRRTALRPAPLALIPDEAHLVAEVRGERLGPPLPHRPVVGNDAMASAEAEGAKCEEHQILARSRREERPVELNLHGDAPSAPGSALAA